MAQLLRQRRIRRRMPHMKFIAAVLSIIAIGSGLLGCPGSGGGGGGSSTSPYAVSTTSADFGVVDNAYPSTSRPQEERLRSPGRCSAEPCRPAHPTCLSIQ